jgi:transposase
MKKTAIQPSKTATEPSGWRAERRWRAWKCEEQGWQAKTIAEALGVKGAVSQWLKKGKTGGKEALRHHPSPGRPRTRRQTQREQVPDLVEQGTEAHGFQGHVWTGHEWSP